MAMLQRTARSYFQDSLNFFMRECDRSTNRVRGVFLWWMATRRTPFWCHDFEKSISVFFSKEILIFASYNETSLRKDCKKQGELSILTVNKHQVVIVHSGRKKGQLKENNPIPLIRRQN